MRNSRALLAAVLLGMTAFLPSVAHAACRTRTVPVPAGFFADPSNHCFEEGLALFHPSQCLPYHLDLLSPRIARGDLSNAIARAFSEWGAPNTFCTPGISAIELAPVRDAKIADYKVGERGHNVFGVVPGAWSHEGAEDTLALATLTFNENTGEIYDVDLELREDVAWSTAASAEADAGSVPIAPDEYSLTAVVLHEVGHVLGLSHSRQPKVVMSTTYTPGTIGPDYLSADDQAGVCSIYPDHLHRTRSDNTLADATVCELSVGVSSAVDAGASDAPCTNPTVLHGCSFANVGTTPSTAWPTAAGFFCVAWRLRRRRTPTARTAAPARDAV